MSKEKQIEEMAKVICGLNTSDGCFCDGGYCNYNCLSYEKAEAIYNAGYRKQSEGEWKVEEFYNSGLRMHFGTNITCSCCGYTERKGSAFFTPSNFCPNCGAKMKGGVKE